MERSDVSTSVPFTAAPGGGGYSLKFLVGVSSAREG